MGCGRSKSTVGSGSPSGSRHNSDTCETNVVNECVNGHKDKLSSHSKVFSFSGGSTSGDTILSRTKAISSSQEEFFRELDERVAQGKEIDQHTLEQESMKRTQQLMAEWECAVKLRPKMAADTASYGSTTQLILRRRSTDFRLNTASIEGATVTDSGHRSTICRSSRRSSRSKSVCLPSDTVTSSMTPAVTSSDPAAGRLLQLGDAFVHDLNASDPNSFVRLNRRPSTYEEVPIPEEAACSELVPPNSSHFADSSLRPRPVDHRPG